jgi:para-aminobenzoate synthetase component 1
LLFENRFVVFSPECFVKIEDGIISSYPMKGTIDASIPSAEEIILNDEKEMAEHITIVDLIRNDLSIAARDVHVEKFRYLEKIETNSKNLLQVSSKIVGLLEPNYNERIGDIIFSMLPAGSISGAPKKKTVEIIQYAEQTKRGYYTGIFGYFDGRNLDSAVMIRFIEKTNKGLIYRSGGGITFMSNVNSEYQELIDKVYVPFN